MTTKQETRPQTALARSQPRDFTDQLIEPFTQLRTEVDRLFEGFPFRMPSLNWRGLAFAVPAIDMSETKKAYKITAELPGLDPDEVEVTVDQGILRIAGEKKEERDEEEQGYRLSERSYGAFERALTLPTAADPNKISAKFKNGVLTIIVAKDGAKQNVRKISVAKS
jgi:HSP20 family protein